MEDNSQGTKPVEKIETNVKVEESKEEKPEEKVEEKEKAEVPDGPEENPETKDEAKKSRWPIAVIIILLVLLATGGVSAWYFLGPNGGSWGGQPQEEPGTIEPSELTMTGNGLSDLDLAFLKMEDEEENVVYSPLSIKYALAMLSEAAADNSKAQITNILGSYQPKAYSNNANRSLANAMYVRSGSEFSGVLKPSYTDNLKTNFNAEVIIDPFTSPSTINNWVSNNTLGIIQNMFDEDNFNTSYDFVLLNALAIDMNWNNQLQCSAAPRTDDDVPCKWYIVKYGHEDYYDSVGEYVSDYPPKVTFDGQNEVPAANVGASTNRYDIINELGEDYIRETVQKEYDEWVEENGEDENFDLDQYIEELSSNYGKNKGSTDFYFYDSENEKVFAKDLQEYDNSTLQYVGFMPKNANLDAYIDSISAEKIGDLIDNLKDASVVENYKDGVITRIKAKIPFFEYSYTMDDLKGHLNELGITDVFDASKANLSGMVDLTSTKNNASIMDALHKADIDFTNDGIRAAASTGFGGGLGAAGSFDYLWDVPVEEIDLTFDKPFFFIIRDKATGEVWFAGKVYNPAD